ncbi:hypothetical protein B0H16DRAFT_1696330 [Mycena metata]|uniref:Uncharacterized protein n=1 Tax=Mycena metata TaxID=1033252 RepID=A0AAD7I124_9AGAR|nr:hypothetical protein B0H16DRAFT_1696330 [Mycena metata]
MGDHRLGAARLIHCPSSIRRVSSEVVVNSDWDGFREALQKPEEFFDLFMIGGSAALLPLTKLLKQLRNLLSHCNNLNVNLKSNNKQPLLSKNCTRNRTWCKWGDAMQEGIWGSTPRVRMLDVVDHLNFFFSVSKENCSSNSVTRSWHCNTLNLKSNNKQPLLKLYQKSGMVYGTHPRFLQAWSQDAGGNPGLNLNVKLNSKNFKVQTVPEIGHGVGHTPSFLVVVVRYRGNPGFDSPCPNALVDGGRPKSSCGSVFQLKPLNPSSFKLKEYYLNLKLNSQIFKVQIIAEIGHGVGHTPSLLSMVASEIRRESGLYQESDMVYGTHPCLLWEPHRSGANPGFDSLCPNCSLQHFLLSNLQRKLLKQLREPQSAFELIPEIGHGVRYTPSFVFPPAELFGVRVRVAVFAVLEKSNTAPAPAAPVPVLPRQATSSQTVPEIGHGVCLNVNLKLNKQPLLKLYQESDMVYGTHPRSLERSHDYARGNLGFDSPCSNGSLAALLFSPSPQKNPHPAQVSAKPDEYFFWHSIIKFHSSRPRLLQAWSQDARGNWGSTPRVRMHGFSQAGIVLPPACQCQWYRAIPFIENRFTVTDNFSGICNQP